MDVGVGVGVHVDVVRGKDSDINVDIDINIDINVIAGVGTGTSTDIKHIPTQNSTFRIAGTLWWCPPVTHGFTHKGPVMRNFDVCIRPFVKRSYHAVAMSVWVFWTFSTCFEISISNLAYTFSKWRGMSRWSFITIRALWPSLQLKVGQNHILQSWPHKLRKIFQVW